MQAVLVSAPSALDGESRGRRGAHDASADARRGADRARSVAGRGAPRGRPAIRRSRIHAGVLSNARPGEGDARATRTALRGIDAGPQDLASRPDPHSDADADDPDHGWPRHRRHDGDFQRGRRGAPPAAPVRGSRPSRAHLHRYAAVQVPVLGCRLPGARSAADALHADRRIPEPLDGLQRRHVRRIAAGPHRVVDLLRRARHHADARPIVHRGGWPARQPAVGHCQLRLLAAAAWRTRRRHRQTHSTRRRRLRPRRRAAAERRPARAAPGVFCGGAVDHAAAQGSVFHHGARAAAQ